MSGELPNTIAPKTFKIVQLNAENLFIYFDDPHTRREWTSLTGLEWQNLSHSTVTNKPLEKVLWLAQSLLQLNPDIICLNEVGGPESMTNFATHFLNDLYMPHLTPGNSLRGIDVGYLVKKTLPLRAELAQPYKERPINFLYACEANPALKSHRLSRDCAELRLFKRDSSLPSLIILLVHLKSKLDPDGIDPQGKERRRAELSTLVEIYQEIREEFIPKVPVIVAGDFNGCARRDQLAEEFQALLNTDLETVAEITCLNGDEAATQVLFSRNGRIQHLQIDFILISPELKSLLLNSECKIHRYQNELQVALNLPSRLDQRMLLPSDHYPVVAVFKSLF